MIVHIIIFIIIK